MNFLNSRARRVCLFRSNFGPRMALLMAPMMLMIPPNLTYIVAGAPLELLVDQFQVHGLEPAQ